MQTPPKYYCHDLPHRKIINNSDSRPLSDLYRTQIYREFIYPYLLLILYFYMYNNLTRTIKPILIRNSLNNQYRSLLYFTININIIYAEEEISYIHIYIITHYF